MKLTSFFILLSFLMIFQTRANSEIINEILEKYYEALGGKENLEKVNSFSMSAESELVILNSKGPFKFDAIIPNMIKVETVINNQTSIQAINKKGGWKILPQMGITNPTDMNLSEIEGIKAQLILFYGPFHRYKEKGSKLSLKNDTTIEDNKYYNLELLSKDSIGVNVFINKNDYKIDYIKSNMKNGENQTSILNKLKDYKKVDGINLAHTYETWVDGVLYTKLSNMKIEINPNIDEKIFEKPANE